MRRNKHNAKRVVALGCAFDSQAEYRYALWLEGERKAGRLLQWSHHTASIPLEVKGRLVATMQPDFTVMRGPQGMALEYHEVKGLATAPWRLKRRLLHALFPRLRYVVVDAGRGVCRTGEGGPALFDERPRKKRRAK